MFWSFVDSGVILPGAACFRHDGRRKLGLILLSSPMALRDAFARPIVVLGSGLTTGNDSARHRFQRETSRLQMAFQSVVRLRFSFQRCMRDEARD